MLGGERTRGLILKVLDISSGKIGAATAQVRIAERQRRSFILLIDWTMKESEQCVCELVNGASVWEREVVLRA